MANPEPIVASLLDLPIDGVYVQPAGTRLRSSLNSCSSAPPSATPSCRSSSAGRRLRPCAPGPRHHGVRLRLGHAEAHDLADLNRPLTEKQLAKQAEKGGGGTAKRVYLTMFKTTMMTEHARPLLAAKELRAELTCSHSCCRFRALEDLPDRARTHYLFQRRAEVDALDRMEEQPAGCRS
jgi:hypothetical protein